MTPTTIWAIGRNYQDHANEMQAPTPKTPVVFIKSPASLDLGNKIHLPSFSQQVDYELEVAVQLGQDLLPTQVALALDLTARDHQSHAKKNSLPWALAKSFKNSLKISSTIPFQNSHWFDQLSFELQLNGQAVQKGQVKNMIFPLPSLLKYLEDHFPLQAGDWILTGTPSGVGPLTKGDQLVATLEESIHWSLEIS